MSSLRRQALKDYAAEFHREWPARVRCIDDYHFTGALFNLPGELRRDPAYLDFLKAKHPEAPFMELPKLGDKKDTIAEYLQRKERRP